ncbi:hypothetical protein WQE_04562 [Paraburkholderia hospita]|uniref:ATPase dynein-related AAA domain-containing protein n=2 Tax=Paraburkholderia hospita TaxID=169430 RepID=A0ABP2PWZ6_9BURK|nr:hypothetical protein WQE_04562 [Paraburkholderia hospita]OUL86589.1 hypothetical protein CA602_15230 [Paraburkholderia hospita]
MKESDSTGGALGALHGSNTSNTDIVLPALQKDQIDELENLDAERKIGLNELLTEIAGLADRLRVMHEEAQKREDDLANATDVVSRERGENSRRAEELARQDSELKEWAIDLKKTASRQADTERDLLRREMSAQADFADQNVAALDALRTEIAGLESRKVALQLEIHEASQKALDEEAQRAARTSEQEAQIAARERSVAQAQRRLDAEWKELEQDRAQIRDDALQEAHHKRAKLVEAQKRAEAQRDNAHRELEQMEQAMAQFRELADELRGRPPRELLDDYAACRRELAALRSQDAGSRDGLLKFENEALLKTQDELKVQLEDAHRNLAQARSQLETLRHGVTDKANLETQKRVLEKHCQILEAQVNRLGKDVDDLTQSRQADKPFPQMSWMDAASTRDWIDERKARELACPEQDVPDLKLFCDELQHRIAQAENDTPLYFRLDDIRLLVAGLAMSRLHIFQGISGTGKTSLAKAFAKAVGGHCTDIAVQAGWRDRDDLLGHYNAFEKRFYERDCLQGLYRAQTDAYQNRCNIILLDEMNLSRPEQYFSEFLSALEKNSAGDRLISLSESALPNAPALLVEKRKIRVPDNVWFVGTANHDETTNEFADKTYDRAHVMTLPRHEERFAIVKQERVSYSHSSLADRFDRAASQHEKEAQALLEEIATGSLTGVLEERFGDPGWGNRFDRQAMRFVPVFMAAGGLKEDALDHLLASRVLRRGKVTGRYDAKPEDIAAVEDAITTMWKGWKSSPRRCLELLANDRRRLEQGA